MLKEDIVRDGEVHYRAGERIQWGVSFTSPLEMLHLPVRLNPEVVICEDNMDSVNYGKKIGRLLNPGVTLGQVIDGILWELSFYGSPASREEESARLKGLADEVASGEAVTQQTVDLYADYKSTLAACFSDTAGVSQGDLFHALQGIGDHDHAETVLRDKLSDAIRLKPEFSSMTGMELRAYVPRNSKMSF